MTIGYERQLANNMAVSADYVHAFSRDLMMSKDLNPGLRATTGATSPLVRQGSATLAAAFAELQQTYPGFAPFTTARDAAGQRRQDRLRRAALSFNKRFSQNYSARVSYTLAYSRGNISGNGVAASAFQVLDDLHLELNEGPSKFDTRHNFVVSGQALVPHTGGLNASWVARALSGSPFSLTNANIDPDRNGTQAEPLAAGSYTGSGATRSRLTSTRASGTARTAGLLRAGRAVGYHFRSRTAAKWRSSSTSST